VPPYAISVNSARDGRPSNSPECTLTSKGEERSDSKLKAACTSNNYIWLIVDGRLGGVNLKYLFSEQQIGGLPLSFCDAKQSLWASTKVDAPSRTPVHILFFYPEVVTCDEYEHLLGNGSLVYAATATRDQNTNCLVWWSLFSPPEVIKEGVQCVSSDSSVGIRHSWKSTHSYSSKEWSES
jgi:hypothetical protein